jgi:hypothetical protein
MRFLLTSLVALASVLSFGATAQTPSPPPPSETNRQSARPAMRDRWFFGGGVGLGFGDVRWIDISPVIGYRATPRISVGLDGTFRYRKDKRFDPEFSTTDYGAGIFGQLQVYKPVFLHAEYEFLSFEFLGTMSTFRETYDSLLFGAGVSQQVGKHTALQVTALYDVTYDSDELSPYSDPWRIGVGVAVGF